MHTYDPFFKCSETVFSVVSNCLQFSNFPLEWYQHFVAVQSKNKSYQLNEFQYHHYSLNFKIRKHLYRTVARFKWKRCHNWNEVLGIQCTWNPYSLQLEYDFAINCEVFPAFYWNLDYLESFLVNFFLLLLSIYCWAVWVNDRRWMLFDYDLEWPITLLFSMVIFSLIVLIMKPVQQLFLWILFSSYPRFCLLPNH